jgi:hypothetical protein
MGQEAIYMMTCIPLPNPEDLKVLVKEAIFVVTPPDDADSKYAALRFCIAPQSTDLTAITTSWASRLGSRYHICLRDILLIQPDSIHDSTSSSQALFALPFLANPEQVSISGTWDTHTSTEVAEFLKAVYQPAKDPGKCPQEFFRVTTTLKDHHAAESSPKYIKAWETEAPMYVSIDVFINNTRIYHSVLEGHTARHARGLLVIVACGLQHLAFLEKETPSAHDPSVLEGPVESFFFNEVKKCSLIARIYAVLCDTASDKATLRELGGVILPLEHHSIIVTFAPTTDDTTRTALPKEIRLVLKNHKTLFFKEVSPPFR